MSEPTQLASIHLIAKFCANHRGMYKAVIAANGVLTLQVAQALSCLGLNWGKSV